MVASGRFALPQYPSKGRMLLLHYEAIDNGHSDGARTRMPCLKRALLNQFSYTVMFGGASGIAPGLSVFQTVLRTSYNKTPSCNLHQLQQAAFTKPSSKCQRSIYPENSNGHLDFSSKTATSSFICCGISPLSTQSNCQ